MKRAAPFVLAALGLGLSCGKSNPSALDTVIVAHDAAAPDAPADAVRIVDAPADAPLFPACAQPTVSGTNVTFRKINTTAIKGGVLTLATYAPGDPRLFVVGANGQIHIFKDEVIDPTPFIDLGSANGGPVTSGDEEGLLGLAFHPQYATNGEFFIYYSTGSNADNSIRDVLARCNVSTTNPDVADPTTCVEVISNANPGPNHHGGMLEFGTDGYLYLAYGQGGGKTTADRSEDLTLLFGKMIRIDVDHPANGKLYGIPPTNPYASGSAAGSGSALPEIYMSGLRNPWRWTFDQQTGYMWIADVGAAAVEEMDVIAPNAQAGADLGWNEYEGSNCLYGPCDPTGKTFPLDQRLHTDGWTAIIGGQVYRGTCYPDLVGWEVYADEGSGITVMAKLQGSALQTQSLTGGTYPLHPTSFHSDVRGEIYATDTQGFVYHEEVTP